MFRIILVAVCCSLAFGEPEKVVVPETSPSAVPVVPVVSTVVPRAFDLKDQLYNKEYYNKDYYNKEYYNKEYYNQYKGADGILSYTNENSGDGTYSYSFATADGKQVQENGFLRDSFVDSNGEHQGTQVVQGSFAYVAPDGTPIQVTYVADENGFRASGAHIPGDGKAAVVAPVPVPVVSSTTEKVNTVYDPNLNKYNPFDYNNRYNNQFGQYNRPYDNRYNNGYDNRYNNRYDNRYNRYDNRFPYNNGGYNQYNSQFYNPSTVAPTVTVEAKSESS